MAHLAAAIEELPRVSRGDLPATLARVVAEFTGGAIVVVSEHVPGDGFWVREIAGAAHLAGDLEAALGRSPVGFQLPASGRAPRDAPPGPAVWSEQGRLSGVLELHFPAERVREIETAIGPRDLSSHHLIVGRRIVANLSVLTLAPLGDAPRACLAAVLQLAVQAYDRFEREADLHQQLEAFGVVAGGVAHDVNNLLMAIQGNVHLTRMDAPDDGPEAELLDEVLTSTRYAGELCRRLQHCSDLRQTEKQLLDLSALIREARPLLSIMIPEGASLECQLEDGLPPLLGDSSQIRQVLMNLVANAAEAIGDDGGAIHIRTHSGEYGRSLLFDTYTGQELRDGTYVLLEVSDNGCGMAEETSNRMFEPFFSRKAAGRGLGLASVMGIVRAHDGTVEVETRPGRGSQIQVLFPIPISSPWGGHPDPSDP